MSKKDDTSREQTPAATTATGDFRQFLCFRLGQREFAVDVMNVREIVRASDVAGTDSLAGNPSYDWHHEGRPTKVFDLRAIFHQGETSLEDSTRVILVDPDERQFGMMVDSVSEIIRVKASSVQPSHATSEKMKAIFPEQVGVGSRSLLCLDPTRLSTSRQPKDS